MAISYFVQGAGAYIAYGLSTDTKPISPSANSTFVETDTGTLYNVSGGAWILATNQKNIKSVNDFPIPVSGVITLVDYTTYIINGTVDIGVNRIVCERCWLLAPLRTRRA